MTLQEFRAEVTAFLAESIEQKVACPAYGAILTPDLADQAKLWQRYCYDNGFAGIHWPTEFGGRGLSREHAGIWYEECARAEVAPYLNLQGIVLAGEALLRAGTPAQKERFLEPTLRGDIVWCQLFSEPGAGSDLAGLATKAVPDGERFVVDGQKVWSSNADIANFGILMARTDPERQAHKGISFFCYDMTLEGTEVRPLRQMTGDAEFCEVFLTDVSMPSDALLGDLHEGWRVAMAVLEDERGSFAAAGAVTLNRRLEALAPNLDASNPVMRARFADLIGRGKALGHLLAHTNGDASMAPVAKVMRSEMDFEVTEGELMSLTASAMLVDGDARDAATDFLYSPGMRIAGGSSEIQRNIIGERLLDLPREPR